VIPYSVDASLDHRPVVNWIAFGGIILAFIVKTRVPAGAIEPFVLQNWSLLGLIAHSWLHINPVHWVLNLLFLWPFGNAVCGKIGNWRYLAVFLGFNLAGGILHAAFSNNPAVAPCAAIAGLVGMYLVFFPENTIGCFFLFPRPMLFDVPGGFIVFVWFVADLVTYFWGVQAVNYCVHILAFAGGAALAILMLRKKWIIAERDEKTLLQMLKIEKQPQEPEAEQKKEPKGQVTEKTRKPQPQQIQQQPQAPGPVKKPSAQPPDNIICFSCDCGRSIKVPAEYAGRVGRCPACKNRLRIPQKSEPSQ